MSAQTQTVTLKGFGPHVRFTTSKPGTVKVVTKDSVKTVPLVKTTDVNFAA
jgi:hypothetical protein